MQHLTTNKRLNKALNELMSEGWQVLRSSKHLVLQDNRGHRLYMPRTTPDRGTTAANYMAAIKRIRRQYA